MHAIPIVETLVSILWKDVGGASCGGGTGPCLDPDPIDTGYLPKLKKAYPNLWTGPELSEAEGCEFNSRLTGGYDRAGHPDGSYGAHNPFLYRAVDLTRDRVLARVEHLLDRRLRRADLT